MRWLALFLVAAPALADCPSAADLEASIVLTDEAGNTDTYRRLADGTMQSYYVDTEGFASRSVLADGIYITSSMSYENGLPDFSSLVRFTYALAEAGYPDPGAGGAWEVEVEVADTSGSYGEQQSYTFGEPGETGIGACSYRSVAIETSYGDWQDLMIYLPDLGFAYVGGSGPAGEAPDPYRMVSIEAVDGK